jgi:glycine hydroxymethyltransferase
MHNIAGKAVGFGEALEPEFIEYADRTVSNAQTLVDVFTDAGIQPVSGGTDKHLLLLDLRDSHPDLTGEEAEEALDDIGITANKNTVPGETRSPFVTSGIRVGTPALTTRGFDADAMETVGELIVERLNNPDDPDVAAEVRDEVDRLCAEFPVYE